VRKVVYSFNVSVDGYIADARGNFGWSVPDEEIHRFHNELAREVDVYLLGRRLYETMVYWDTAEEEDPDLSEVELEFARAWKPVPKLVFSRTLTSVEGNARLAERDVAEEAALLAREPGDGYIAVGGAELASALVERDLVDEYRLFINPVIVGGGTPFLPSHPQQLDLTLAETRTFGSRVVYLRYERKTAHR
jgi:dihydrofolate reductase